MLSYGASVNIQTRSGGATALHRSAFKGHIDVTQLLVDRGANVSLLDGDGKTALHKVKTPRLSIYLSSKKSYTLNNHWYYRSVPVHFYVL